MNTWKISNTSNQYIKIACKTASSASKGIILEPNQFCISENQLTSSLDIQERRGFLTIDRKFDNSKVNLEFVKAYTEEELNEIISNLGNESVVENETEKTDFEKAAENVEKYINNSGNE
jgi:hypothetical protein